MGKHYYLVLTAYLEDVGPALARDEEPVALRVVRDAVEHMLSGCGTEMVRRWKRGDMDMEIRWR